MIYNRPEYWLAKTETVVPYLTFSSPSSFTLAVSDSTKHWDGTLEYSTDTSTWSAWDGTTALSSAISESDNVLYLRGIGNTKIGYFGEEGPVPWTINGADIRCDGNIETLLDYATVEAGQHPVMAEMCFAALFMECTALITPPALPATTLASYCYASMFQDCTSLTQAPELPATTLASYCYTSMFQDCTSLTQAPELPAITLVENCYNSMFDGCAKIKLSSTQTGEYTIEYRIPMSGEGTDAMLALGSMFARTGGTFAETPKINTTYYLSNTNTVV